MAPVAPLRLSRRWARIASSAVDRTGVSAVIGRHRLLVDALGSRRCGRACVADRATAVARSRAPNEITLRITAKALGDGSARLAYLRRGTRVLFEGPYGRLSSRARTQRKIV